MTLVDSGEGVGSRIYGDPFGTAFDIFSDWITGSGRGDGAGAWSTRTIQGRELAARTNAPGYIRRGSAQTYFPTYTINSAGAPLDSTIGGLGKILPGIYGKVAAGVLTVGGYALDYWRRKAKEEEAARKKEAAQRLKEAQARVIAERQRQAAAVKSSATARQIADTAFKNQQAIQRMQMTVATQSQRERAGAAILRERAREFDANLALRKAQQDVANRASAERAAAEIRKAIEAKAAALDAEAIRKAEETAKLRIAIKAAKAAQQQKIYNLVANILLETFKPKIKLPGRRQPDATSGGPQGFRPILLSRVAYQKRRKKRKKKVRHRRKRLTATRKHRVG